VCSVESQVLVTQCFKAVLILSVLPFSSHVLKLLSIFLVEIDTLEKALVIEGSLANWVEKTAQVLLA
jgi:hypothetical protein